MKVLQLVIPNEDAPQSITGEEPARGIWNALFHGNDVNSAGIPYHHFHKIDVTSSHAIRRCCHCGLTQVSYRSARPISVGHCGKHAPIDRSVAQNVWTEWEKYVYHDGWM